MIIRYCSSLNSVTMVGEKKFHNVKSGKLVERLYRSKRSKSSQADNSKHQYNDLLQPVCVIPQEKFSNLDCKSE